VPRVADLGDVHLSAGEWEKGKHVLAVGGRDFGWSYTMVILVIVLLNV